MPPGSRNRRERDQQELDINVTLIAALMGGRGYADPEVATALERANRLVTHTGGARTPQHFSVLYGLWAVLYNRGQSQAARAQATEFLSLAQSCTESGHLLIGHRLLATAMLGCGDYREALPHLERAASLYRPKEHREFTARYGQDIGVSALVYLAWALWHRGYPEQSARAAGRALEYGRQFGHAHTLAYALWHIGRTAIFARRVDEVGSCANECVALADEHGFSLWAGSGRILQGWVGAHNGDMAAGIARIREGLTRAGATGSRTFNPVVSGWLAEALALAGEVDEGLEVLDQALANSAASGQNGADAELHRLRGELVRQLPRSDPAQAEASSLARLWGEQGRRGEACELLAPVYGWFTEGFDTPDLKDAKALLDEMG